MVWCCVAWLHGGLRQGLLAPTCLVTRLGQVTMFGLLIYGCIMACIMLCIMAMSSPAPPSLLCPSSPHGYPMLEALQEQDSGVGTCIVSVRCAGTAGCFSCAAVAEVAAPVSTLPMWVLASSPFCTVCTLALMRRSNAIARLNSAQQSFAFSSHPYDPVERGTLHS